MIYSIIKEKKNKWLQSNECTVSSLIQYIREKGQLRDAQIEAIETYLFLKIKGENKPLWQLFSEGFFCNGIDLDRLNINQIARDFLRENKNAFALYDFVRAKNGNRALLPQLEKQIIENPHTLEYEDIIKNIFYGVNYADYLMSLPMGAGKTYLMAAFIYLDFYFADNEPDNKKFAHNFVILIPAGKKTSLIPSLKTIENFDASWVLAEPSASKFKKILQFEVLDEAKNAKKSNKARNPNAQKVNACLPNPFGRVFVVNAEKVVLESFKFNAQMQLEVEAEEKDTTNDLKRLFGQIPNLSILIDEVHHAATDDIKLRQVINYWQRKGNICSVLGFSGTPYLPKTEKIKAGDFELKFSQISNTVYYYPLITAIKHFLKTPTIKVGQNLERLQIIKTGIEDFQARYGNTVYENGTIAKIALYCASIEALEEEIYPYLTTELGINPNEILKFHGGNKAYSLPKENELAFRSLDLPISNKRYILLVQIGKEGWDCRSLTGVILSQTGDSPKNMVLQTACRCLRQVDKGRTETALIWLNKGNADILNEQLKQEQNSSIEELNHIRRNAAKPEYVQRHSRMDYLNVPSVDFYQLKVSYQSLEEEETTNTEAKLTHILTNIETYKTAAFIRTSEIENLDTGSIDLISATGIEFAHYNQWIFEISRQSFGLISEKELHNYDTILTQIFEIVSFEKNGIRFFNDLYDLYAIQSKIRLAFSIKRTLTTTVEEIPVQAELLITANLGQVEKNAELFPNQAEVQKVLELDRSNAPLNADLQSLEKDYQKMKNVLETQGMGNFVPSFEAFRAQHELSPVVKAKNQSFHYLPYNFGASGSSSFEKESLQKILQLTNFQTQNLEIYYNGERGLTEFVINCFAKTGNFWKNIGKYTTDFLIVKRDAHNKLHKILLIETKGSLYAADNTFQQKKKYIETEFLKLNNEKFGYQRFDFLYLEGKMDDTNVANTIQKINAFFSE